GVGALVISAGPELVGHEVYVCTADREQRRSHNVVRERQAGHRSVYAAVFPDLAAGEYRILSPTDDVVSEPVVIRGGAVTEAHMRSASERGQAVGLQEHESHEHESHEHESHTK